MSYGDNIVVTEAYSCKIAIKNSEKEIMGNPSDLLNVFNRLKPKMCLLLQSI